MNFNPLIPELSVSHFEKSFSFYTEVLKFRVEYQRPEHHFAFLSYQGCQLMIEQENAVWKTGTLEYPYGRGINLAMLVDTLDVLLPIVAGTPLPSFCRASGTLVSTRTNTSWPQGISRDGP